MVIDIRKWRGRCARPLGALALAGAPPALAQGYPPITFEEREFGPGSTVTVSGSWGMPGGGSISHIATGGNPGGFGEVSITVGEGNPGPNFPFGSSGLGAFLLAGGRSYDLASLGGIASLTYLVDSRYISGIPGGGCLCSGEGVALRQNGKLYGADGHATLFSWGTHTSGTLRASDFQEVLFGDPRYSDPNSHPDFSSSGAPLEVGFDRSNSNSNPGFVFNNVRTGADNFIATVVPCMRLSALAGATRTCASNPVTLEFSADPAYPVTLQWQVDDPKNPGEWLDITDGPVGDGLSVAGAATTSVTLTPTAKRYQAGVHRRFRCVLTNKCGVGVRETVLTTCIADYNCDGVVNSTDVSDFINQWFTDQIEGSSITDWDVNGVVNSTDVSAFINSWFEDTAGGCD